jgi:hypothetical protein
MRPRWGSPAARVPYGYAAMAPLPYPRRTPPAGRRGPTEGPTAGHNSRKEHQT